MMSMSGAAGTRGFLFNHHQHGIMVAGAAGSGGIGSTTTTVLMDNEGRGFDVDEHFAKALGSETWNKIVSGGKVGSGGTGIANTSGGDNQKAGVERDKQEEGQSTRRTVGGVNHHGGGGPGGSTGSCNSVRLIIEDTMKPCDGEFRFLLHLVPFTSSPMLEKINLIDICLFNYFLYRVCTSGRALCEGPRFGDVEQDREENQYQQ